MFGTRTGALAALAAAAALVICAPATAHATAAPAVRIVPVAGTGHHLVYGTYSPVRSGKATVQLHVLDDRGRTRALGTVRTTTPTAIPASAAGRSLVVAKDGSASWRWDLATGARTTIGARTVAAPGGYAVAGTNGEEGEGARQTVELVTDRGTTRLGVPFPKGENVDGAFHLASGSTGVTITDGNGHIRFIAWAKPGEVRSLRGVGSGASVASLACSTSTSTTVACSSFDEETTTLLAVRLDGSRGAKATPDCLTAPAALKAGIAWLGCRNRLQILHWNGSVTTSKRAFGSARPVSAFGRVVLQSSAGTSLQTMTRTGAAPVTVATAR